MDSHLSNAQRCARKADALVKYGMYDEAFSQLDRSISLLKELKSLTTRYENIQMLSVQIESIDRKKRSVAIKRSESIKKKQQQAASIKNRVQHIPISVSKAQASGQQSVKKCDQSPVIIEYCYNSDKVNIVTSDQSQQKQKKKTPEIESMFVQGRKKLDKDESSIIEELSTTNAEYKKVNSYLVSEIEQLKRENDLLKIELIKVHMSDSLSSSDSLGENRNQNQNLNSSTPKQTSLHQGTAHKLDSSLHTVPCFNVTSNSSGHSSTSSSSWSISTNSANSSQTSHHSSEAIHQFKSVDLSKYIDDDEEDDDNLSNHYEFDEDSNDVNAHPPFEFTCDSAY